MRPESDREEPKVAGGASRDKKRLAIGLGFMALLLAGTLVSAFLLGVPDRPGRVAPGVPLLILGGWAAVIASALVFYRTFPGE